MLYIKSSGLTHFITESLYLLTTFTHFAHPPCLLGMILEVQGVSGTLGHQGSCTLGSSEAA